MKTMQEERDPKKLTPQQQAAWDKRCLVGVLGNIKRMKDRFEPEDITLITHAFNKAIGRIDKVLHGVKPMVAKKWSDQR